MVYYRKYRPQTIDELDNEDVRKTLSSVLASSEPPHAFLFTGPKGLGKTSSARIVAKALNCEKIAHRTSHVANRKAKDHIEPCNECEMCLSITEGTNLDVLEIDAASNRGIDEIRDLREKIRLSPVSARKKVYIIDEVHMLTTEAFNALLKTLEEPPSHAVFILATTEPQKVPATILSRCLHVSFHKATEAELLRSFQRIVKAEGIEISEAALLEIAKLSDGGFRDGVKILEEMVFAAGGKEVSVAMIEAQYHSVSSKQHIVKLIEKIAQNDVQGSIAIVNDVAGAGSDMKYFLEQLLLALHEMLLQNVGVGEKIQTPLNLAEIRELSDALQKAHQQMRTAVVSSLPLELALIGYMLPSTAQNVTERNVLPSATTQQVGKDLDLNGMRRKVGELQKQRAVTNEKEEEKKEEKPEATGASLMAYKASGDLTPEWLTEFWQTFILKVKEKNHTISGVLRGCKLQSFDRKNLIIETSYKFHKDRLSESKTLTALSEAASAMAGNPVSVTIELKSSK
ncbi:MAG: hypothetical protein RLZZ455_211 [Candidatus Parcubacteria bacterium]|jgi:DNA polymerase-3 subunit gamma/tau